MIDLKARSLLAAAIDSYLDNRCDNFELDDTFFSIKTTDELVLEIRRQLWFFYDDTYVHKIADKMALSPEYRAAWRRWVYLLHTDAEWHAVPDGLAQSKEHFRDFAAFCELG